MLRTLIVIAVSVALTGDAFAFQIETPITAGCHEQITIEGMRAAGFPNLADAPVPTEDQRRARNDLTFTLPAENDVWTMTMLIGLRSNDIRDLQVVDVAELVHIYDDPDDQPAHCIHEPRLRPGARRLRALLDRRQLQARHGGRGPPCRSRPRGRDRAARRTRGTG